MKIENVEKWEGLNIKKVMDWIIWGKKNPYEPMRRDQEKVDNLIDNEIKNIKYDNF